MKEITHKQARRYLRMDLDGLLTDLQRRTLQTHLDSCPACRAESESFSTLTARLQSGFRSRWDAHDGPSENVMANVRSQTRRIIMNKRIDFAFNIFGGIVTFLVFGFVIISVISYFTEKPTAANETQTVVPASAPRPEDRLIAFVSNVGLGNRDIFTMKADGSELINITNNPATDGSPAWSPDGTQIAFVSDRSGGRDIYLMYEDGSNVRKLTDSSTYNDHFVWSPDGTRIAYLSSENSLFDASQLLVMNADGSNKVTLTTEPGTYNILGWSPDSRNIVYQKWWEDPTATSVELRFPDADIYIVDVESTSTIHGFTGIDFGIPRQIQWENSEQLVLLGYNLNAEPPTWQLSRMFVTTDTSVYNRFGPTIVSSKSPIVAMFDRTYVVESEDTLSWFAYSGAPIPMSPWNFSQICNIPGDPLAEETTHIVSPSREQAFVTIHCDGTTRFYLENANGSQFVQLTDFSIVDPLIAGINGWAPDGRYVIATISNRRGQDIYRFDIQEMLNDPSTQPVQLTTDGVLKYGAVWQPVVNANIVEKKPTTEPTKPSTYEGLIAFTGTAEDGNTEIYTMRADGSGLTNLTNHEALDSNPAWSPDGRRIAFQSNRAAFTQIYLMGADGSNVTQLTFDPIDHEMTMNYAQSSPWSPDGNHLLFFQRVFPEKGSPPVPLELYSIDINTRTKTMLASGNISLFNVTWSPDGKHIAFILENPSKPGDFHIFVVDESGSNLNEITKSLHPNERLANFNYRWSPDGQSLIFIAMNEKSQQWFAYEMHLDGGPLVQKTRTNSTLGDWWNGTSFIVGFRTTLTWLRSDGTKSTLEPFEKCNSQDDPQYSWFYRRSSKGDYLVGVVCLHSSDLFFYFANSDGIGAKQLFNSPLSGDIIDTAWSDDGGQVIAILSTSIGIDLYRFDIEEMLKDPSKKPVQLTTDGALKGVVVWQPMP